MINDIYTEVVEELKKLNNAYKLNEFIDKKQATHLYSGNDVVNQFTTFIKITSNNPYNESFINWEINDSRWQKALNSAKEKNLKSDNANNTEEDKYVLKVSGLNVIKNNEKTNLGTGYIKLLLDENGNLNREITHNPFKKIVDTISNGTKGLKFNNKLFILVKDKREASQLNLEDSRVFINIFKDLSKKGSSMEDGFYIADNLTSIFTDKLSSENIRVKGNVNSDFVIACYIVKRLNLINLSSLNENNAENEILNLVKENDSNGIIRTFLKESSDITKSIIFNIIDNIKEYTKDKTEISRTLSTIFNLINNDDLEFTWNSFLNTNRFSINLVLSGILNNVSGGSGDTAAGYERILTHLGNYANPLSRKVENLRTDFELLTEGNISRWLVLKECNGVNSTPFLETLRKYCVGELSKNDFKKQIKLINNFTINVDNFKTCSLRDINSCAAYWNIFTEDENYSNKKEEETLKLYVGKNKNNLYYLDKISENEFELNKEVTLDSKNYFISFGYNSGIKMPIEENLNKLFSKMSNPQNYFKNVTNKLFLIGDNKKSLTFEKLKVKLENINGVITVSSIEISNLKEENKNKEISNYSKEETKEKNNSKEKQKEITSKEESKFNGEWIKIKAVNDKREFNYKISPNGKVFYRLGIHDSNSKPIYVIKLQGNIYANINSIDAHRYDPKLPSDEEIKIYFNNLRNK